MLPLLIGIRVITSNSSNNSGILEDVLLQKIGSYLIEIEFSKLGTSLLAVTLLNVICSYFISRSIRKFNSPFSRSEILSKYKNK
jgi:hypothetical protein